MEFYLVFQLNAYARLFGRVLLLRGRIFDFGLHAHAYKQTTYDAFGLACWTGIDLNCGDLSLDLSNCSCLDVSFRHHADPVRY